MLLLSFLNLILVTAATDGEVDMFSLSSSPSWNFSGYVTYSGVYFSCNNAQFIGFKEEIEARR